VTSDASNPSLIFTLMDDLPCEEVELISDIPSISSSDCSSFSVISSSMILAATHSYCVVIFTIGKLI
jgi:hypothetical protein